MITIKVNVTDGANETLRGLISDLTGAGMVELNEAGARGAVEAARDHHNTFEKGGGWKGSRYMRSTAPGVQSGRFGANIAAGWFFSSASADGAVIANTAEHYGFRIRGGTITPKRVSWLTLPLVPEAKGISAQTYQENAGRRLFRPKGKNVLMEKTDGGGVRSIYALVKSVTMPPFPAGLPPEDLLAEHFTDAWRKRMADRIEKA